MPAHTEQPWDACPSGTLTGLGQRLRRDRRGRRTAAAAGGVAVVAVLLLAAMIVSQQLRTDGLTCGQVRPHLAAYVSGELQGRLETQVAAHLDHCPLCQRRVEQLRRERGGQSGVAMMPAVAAVVLRGR